MALSLSDLLKRLMEMSGSDLHITTNSPPQIRVHGHLVPLDLPQMTPAETKQLAYSVMTDSQKHRFEENFELDFSFGLKGLARFRANVFNQRGATSAVFRIIPFEIKSFNQLGLPAVVSKMCDKPRGLVLVTGPTGSGKSTTLAAMIDKINSERHDHILTIEDPIEFVHMNKNCVVNQRELHADTKSFSDALRAALREDPDVVLIGEMRDLETIESALRIAETGHLTFGTLHTNSASSTINRIIDVFPSHQQPQIRAQLSLVLEGIMCQSLLPKGDGKGRAMCMEILVPNAAVRNLIREDPDVVLIGEMRDLETIESALRIAETGHLTFGTLHTNSASSTINRIIDVFPAHQQSQIRAQLSLVLEGILCQSLLPRADNKGRVMCMEVLVPNAAVRNLIREDKIHQIYSAMQSGQEKFGMQTFNQSLATAYFQKQIAMETALSRSSNQDELQEMMSRGTSLLSRAGSAPMGRGAASVKR